MALSLQQVINWIWLTGPSFLLMKTEWVQWCVERVTNYPHLTETETKTYYGFVAVSRLALSVSSSFTDPVKSFWSATAAVEKCHRICISRFISTWTPRARRWRDTSLCCLIIRDVSCVAWGVIMFLYWFGEEAAGSGVNVCRMSNFKLTSRGNLNEMTVTVLLLIKHAEAFREQYCWLSHRPVGSYVTTRGRQICSIFCILLLDLMSRHNEPRTFLHWINI